MLSIEGELVLERGATRIRMRGEGETLAAHVEGIAPSAVLGFVRGDLGRVRLLIPLLVRAGLAVNVLVGGVTVARAGAGVEADLVGRTLNVANLRLGG